MSSCDFSSLNSPLTDKEATTVVQQTTVQPSLRIALWHCSKTLPSSQQFGLGSCTTLRLICVRKFRLCHAVTSFSLAGVYVTLHVFCAHVNFSCQNARVVSALGLRNMGYTIPFSLPYPTISAYWPVWLGTLQHSGGKKMLQAHKANPQTPSTT